ncbi:hypothetical protein Tco_1391134, partial [Tanacetum coccineum]
EHIDYLLNDAVLEQIDNLVLDVLHENAQARHFQIQEHLESSKSALVMEDACEV